MGTGPSGLPKWLIAGCVVFGILVGYVIAAIAASFWGVVAGEENRGVLVLIWTFAAVIFCAWPLHIVVRAQAVRRQHRVMRERIGDLDYEPPTFPILGTRATGPKDELGIKAPDIGEAKLSRFFARGRTAEQRMADHLKSLEIKAEMERAKWSDADRPTGGEAKS